MNYWGKKISLVWSYRHKLTPISSFTCDVEFLAEAGFALVFDCDLTFITPGVGRPGRVEFVYDLVSCGGRGVDGNVVLRQLESMSRVWDAVMTDADLALYGHRGPARHCAAG